MTDKEKLKNLRVIVEKHYRSCPYPQEYIAPGTFFAKLMEILLPDLYNEFLRARYLPTASNKSRELSSYFQRTTSYCAYPTCKGLVGKYFKEMIEANKGVGSGGQ